LLDHVDATVLDRCLVPAYQPVVSLPGGHVVGYEALARWPELGNPAPQKVLAYAQSLGCLETLDRACITSAAGCAIRQRLTAGSLLFINCEPGGDYADLADDPVMTRARERFEIVFELTERSLLDHPQALLRKVSDMRADGVAIALDDVGSHPASAALLDILSPDIVKLDMGLLQRQPRPDQARTIGAVLAYHERADATIVAEGIETEDQVKQAMALGASLGQGYRFGRADPRLGATVSNYSLKPVARQTVTSGHSLFSLVAPRAPIRITHTETMVALSRLIADQAQCAADPPIVLTALQKSEYYNGDLRDRYERMAARSPLVAVFSDNADRDFGTGVRAVAIDPADPLSDEWALLALGPHFAAALVARLRTPRSDLGVPDIDSQVDLRITYDRSLVVDLARSLLGRMP